MICLWCKGKKKIGLTGHDPIICPNCKGSGFGKDGGQHCITGFKKPYLLGNKHWIRRKDK